MSIAPQPPAGYRLLVDATPRQAPTWGLPSALLVIAGWFALSIALAVPLLVLNLSDSSLLLVLSTALPTLAAGVATIIISRRNGNGPAIDFGLRLRWSQIGVGLFASTLMVVAASIIALMLSATGAEIPVAADVVFQEIKNNPVAAALFLFTVVFIAPLCEELMYRGMLYGAIERKLSARWAMLISSGAFAAAHFEPQRFVILLALGLALGELRLRTGGITATTAAHFGINSVAALGLLATTL